MSARPLISVIIPTHNRAALLARALDSVFLQYGLGEQFDLEVIVVDDGSTDSTATVVGEYAQARWLRFSTSRGVAAARNAGIESSRGAFICFLDDDDVWLPGRLKLQIPAFSRHPQAGALYSQVFDAHDGKAYPASSRAVSGRIFDALLSGNLIGGMGSVLIRHEALEKTGYFDESLPPCEDWDLWLRLSFHFPFVFVPGLVAVYLPSPRGLWQSGEKRGNNARVIEKALQMIPDSGRYAALKRAARARTALKHGQTWAEILAALCTDPFILRQRWARHYVSRWTLKLALGSEAPLSTLQELCVQIKEATADARVSRWRVRQTVAKSWAEIASALAVRPARQQEAAYAATRAVALAPSLLVGGAPHAPGHQRRRALAPIIVRGALASCAGSARSSETT